MHLDGTHTLNASAETIWALLMDHEVLARVTPSITRLEPQGDDHYIAVAEVKIGPVEGSFKGNMSVADKKEQEQFTLRMQQNSQMGNVNAEGQLILNKVSEEQTEIVFSGDAKLSGTLARMGQRLIGSVANMLIKQFFKNLEKEIQK